MTSTIKKSLKPYNEESVKELYEDNGYSWAEIAKLYNSYPNKVRRDGIKWGIQSRDKSDAQSTAISSGRHPHPTKGTHRSEEVKIKISDGMAEVWKNLTDDEREARIKQAQEQWAEMSDAERKEFQHLAAVAIREAAKSGSKLEKYLTAELSKLGYYVEAHRKHLILNENLHLDLFLPKLGVAIEVNGPSHFEDIWGGKTLQRNQKADAEKTGLILGKGLVFISVKHTKALSAKVERTILAQLVDKLKSIEKKFPSRNNRYIEIGE